MSGSGETATLNDSTEGSFSESQGQSHTPDDEILHTDAAAAGAMIQCPTCMGLGKVPRGQLLNHSRGHLGQGDSQSYHDMSLREEDGTEVDKEVYNQIRKEMREQGITQEIFAAVSFGRTQGLLSEMLRKSEQNVRENRTTRQNLLMIQEFLDKPVAERKRMYKDYKMESKNKRRIRKEYYEDSSEPPYKKKTVISALAKGVMLEYLEQISDNPDRAGLDVMSDVLNLDKDIIQRFFKHERARRNLEQYPELYQQQLADSGQNKE